MILRATAGSAAAQTFANQVWDNPKIHNKQQHLIKLEEWTSAYKLREQAALVKLLACLAWLDNDKDLMNLASLVRASARLAYRLITEKILKCARSWSAFSL